MDDDELIGAVAAGDDAALRTFLRATGIPLLAYQDKGSRVSTLSRRADGQRPRLSGQASLGSLDGRRPTLSPVTVDSDGEIFGGYVQCRATSCRCQRNASGVTILNRNRSRGSIRVSAASTNLSIGSNRGRVTCLRNTATSSRRTSS